MRSTSCPILLALFAGLLTVGTNTAHADTRVHYLYNDSRGTPVAAANDQGQVLWRKHYRPFGAEAELAGDTIETVADDRGFTGHTYDRESGLVYMGARHYNPQLGIFYGTDPAPVAAAVPLTFNRYIYANQNPYGYIDPNGQDAVDAGIGIVMGFVNGIGIMMAAAASGLNAPDHGERAAQYTANAIAAVEFVPEPFVWSEDYYDDADFRYGVDFGKALGSFTASLSSMSRRPACFVVGTPVKAADGFIAIEDIRVGDRVETAVGGNTFATDTRWIRLDAILLAHDDEDSRIHISLLKPEQAYPNADSIYRGSSIRIALPELNIDDLAQVEQIQRGIKVSNGSGRLVVATASRLSNDVYELSFVEGREPLRGTGTHPLYSVDRDDWVRIRDLQVGERLQTAEGAVTIEVLEKVRGVHRVYNLEVEGDHEYLVGKAGVRAHNNKVHPGSPPGVGGACFPARTMVSTETGLRPIEGILEGDLVACAEPGNGTDQLCEVESLIRYDFSGALVSITTTAEVIEATGSHPFWVSSGTGLAERPTVEEVGEERLATHADGRWVAARDLKAGDELLAFDSDDAVFVEEIAVRHAQLPVFNLTVEGLHTYEVSASRVLVHNKAMRATGLWKSVKRFGHTFKTHGAGAKNTRSLMDRARSTGNNQGQWLNNDSAANFLSDLSIQGPVSTRIPAGLGQVIRPDGSIVSATWARVVPGPDGIRTAFPILP